MRYVARGMAVWNFYYWIWGNEGRGSRAPSCDTPALWQDREGTKKQQAQSNLDRNAKLYLLDDIGENNVQDELDLNAALFS